MSARVLAVVHSSLTSTHPTPQITLLLRAECQRVQMANTLSTTARGAPAGRVFVMQALRCRRQCIDSKGNTIALWETSQLTDPFAAKLTLKPAALLIVTEIVTTLTLNRIAMVSNWE